MIRIDEYFPHVANMGMGAAAITDHGSLSSIWKAQRAADRAGVKLIVGLETYLAIGDRHNTGDTAADGPRERGFIEIDRDDASGDEGSEVERSGETDADRTLSDIDQLATHLASAARSLQLNVESLLRWFMRAPNDPLKRLAPELLEHFHSAAEVLRDEPRPKGGVAAVRAADALRAARHIAEHAGRRLTELLTATKPLKRRYHEHLTLIAQDETGWRNLLAMQNEASKPASRYQGKPRVDRALLEERAEGIICLTGCLGGPVLGPLSRGSYGTAAENLDELIAIFGTEQVYVEIMEHGIEDESRIIPDAVKLAQSRGVRIVATNDAHYLHADQASAHAAWLAHQSRSTVANPKYAFHGAGYHVADEAEMLAKRPEPWWREACEESARISSRIADRVVPGSRLRLPHFPIPDGYDDTASYFRDRVLEGAQARFGDGPLPDAVRARLNEEVAVVQQMGMLDYFLIVEDMITWAKSQGIIVGHGRGSAAGSMLSYCLGIHNIDPLEHGLLFERFLEPGREGMPDIDTDFEAARRGEVFAYLARKWGEGNVARIGSFTYSRTKKAIKDAARVLELEPVGNRLAKEVPIEGGRPLRFPELADLKRRDADAFRAALSTGGVEANSVARLASEFEGLVSGLGIHACGFLITDEPIAELVPLRYDSNATAADEGVAAYTAWDGADVEDMGLCKIDVLGLTNLDIVREALASISGDELSLDTIPDPDTKDDPKVEAAWKLLRDGSTEGLFQIEGAGITDLVRDIRPSSWADLTAALALYRPGPMSIGMHQHYGSRKHGREPVLWSQFTTDPEEQRWLQRVLGVTYAIPVYQEQVMQLSQVIAGFDAKERSQLRRAMGKKKKEVMDAMKAEFTNPERCAKVYTDPATGEVTSPKFSPETAERIWHAVEGAAEYLFNKCLPADTTLDLAGGGAVSIGELLELEPQDLPELISVDPADGRLRACRAVAVHHNGVQQLYRVTLANGMSVRGTAGHRFLTTNGWRAVAQLRVGSLMLTSSAPGAGVDAAGAPTAISVIRAIEPDGVEPTYDMEMVAGSSHSFIADGIVSHNSHSQAYAKLTFDTAFLKANWPAAFGAGILATQKGDDKRAGAMRSLAREGIEVLPPDVNQSHALSMPEGKRAVRLGLAEIKGVGSEAAAAIIENRKRHGGTFTKLSQPSLTTATEDLTSGKIGVGVHEALIQAGALDALGPRLGMMVAIRAQHRDDPSPVPDIEWSTLERSSRQRRVLLTSFGAHPLDEYAPWIDNWRPEGGLFLNSAFEQMRTTVETLPSGHRERVVLIALLAGASARTYSGGKLMDLTFEGRTGTATSGVMWNDAILDQEALGGMPEIGAVIAARGEVRSRRYEVEVVDESTGDVSIEVREEPQLTISSLHTIPVPDDSRRVMLPPRYGTLSFGDAVTPPSDDLEATADVADPTQNADDVPTPSARDTTPNQPEKPKVADPDPDPDPDPKPATTTGKTASASVPQVRASVTEVPAAYYPRLNKRFRLQEQGVSSIEFDQQVRDATRGGFTDPSQPAVIDICGHAGVTVLQILPA